MNLKRDKWAKALTYELFYYPPAKADGKLEKKDCLESNLLLFERETDDDETVFNGLSSFRYHDISVMIVGNSIKHQLLF
jgi:hypothetical protein